jgi:GntR family transcriptional regulator, sialic acid-inducible nan operon repressor
MTSADLKEPQSAELVSWPIRRRKLSEEAALRLEAMIRDGTFPQGTMLPPERDLMKIFGVGRGSIREALFALNRMGLVQLRNGERPRVRTPTPETLITELSGTAHHFLTQPEGALHFQDARALFEVGIARTAAERATTEDIERLRQALAANTAARGDTSRFERTDVAFHYVLATITKNPIFTAVHDALVEWLTSQRTMSLRVPGAEESAHESHRQIYEAVAARDPVAAARAMDEHLKDVAALIQRSKEANDDPARDLR